MTVSHSKAVGGYCNEFHEGRLHALQFTNLDAKSRESFLVLFPQWIRRVRAGRVSHLCWSAHELGRLQCHLCAGFPSLLSSRPWHPTSLHPDPLFMEREMWKWWNKYKQKICLFHFLVGKFIVYIILVNTTFILRSPNRIHIHLISLYWLDRCTVLFFVASLVFFWLLWWTS